MECKSKCNFLNIKTRGTKTFKKSHFLPLKGTKTALKPRLESELFLLLGFECFFALMDSDQILPDNEIESDLEAIQAANRGISTKNLPNAENRGYGIITSKKMLIDGLGGTFVMMSGNALHLYNSLDRRFVETPENIRWNGTIIALRVPYMNKDFQYINYIE